MASGQLKFFKSSENFSNYCFIWLIFCEEDEVESSLMLEALQRKTVIVALATNREIPVAGT